MARYLPGRAGGGRPPRKWPAVPSPQPHPLGLQVIGKALDEGTVLAVGRALEDAAGFTAKAEKWWS